MKKDKIFIKKLSKKQKNMHLLSITGIYSLFESKNSPDFYFEGECHSPWEMVYVIEGSAGITADDKIYTLSKGDIVFHKPMEFHKIWSANETNLRALICAFDLEGSLSHRIGGVYHLVDESKNIMDSLLKYLHAEFKEKSAGGMSYFTFFDENEVALQIVLNQLELILLNISHADKREQKPYHSEKMRLYTKIAEILEEHIYDKITISEIAEICHVSPATIKNCFAEYAGCGVHKYFLNIKIRAAIDMLQSGMNINEVSDTLQFANPNYFSYLFKRETGMPASTYKK